MSLKLNPQKFLILKLYFSALIPFAITYLHISILNYCESNRTILGSQVQIQKRDSTLELLI